MVVISMGREKGSKKVVEFVRVEPRTWYLGLSLGWAFCVCWLVLKW